MSAFAIPYTLENKEQRLRGMAQGMCGSVHWSWVIPLAQWIGNRRCLEIMSGRGLLAYALQELGVHILPTDNFSWTEDSRYSLWHNRFTTVENIDCLKAIRKYGTDIEIMIMCWPPFNDSIAYQSIRALYKVNSEALVIYIGEDRFGSSAEEQFFDHFTEVKDRTFRNVVERYESWYGVHDYPRLGRYKP